MTGRPTSFSPEIGQTICRRIADGESLRAICRDEAAPGKSTVFDWLAADPDFAALYAKARELQADSYVDEIVSIADDEPDPQRAKVRVSTRQWAASKLRPKVYGDRQTVEHAGAVGLTHRRAVDLTDDELAAHIVVSGGDGASDPAESPD